MAWISRAVTGMEGPLKGRGGGGEEDLGVCPPEGLQLGAGGQQSLQAGCIRGNTVVRTAFSSLAPGRVDASSVQREKRE